VPDFSAHRVSRKKVAPILRAGGLRGSGPVLFGWGSTAARYHPDCRVRHYMFV
jgi:hypothetical protein